MPDTSTATQPRLRAPWWRRGLTVILLIVGCLLAPVSVLGIWARSSLLDTDGYVETVGPLVDDPAIQEALATRVTDRLFEQVDVEDTVVEALPDRAAFIAPFVTDGLQGFVHDRALQLVASDQFSELWKRVNRRAHAQVLAVLEGEGTETVATRNGQVVLDLEPLVDRVKARLADRGIDLFDDVEVETQFTLFESEGLRSAQSGVRLLEKLTFALPVLSLLLIAGAVALSRDRRRTLLWGALGLAVSMAVVLTGFNLGRSVYLDAIADAGRNTDAAAAAYDQVLDFLRISLRTAMVLGVVVAIGASLAGPGRLATRMRGGIAGLAHRGADADASPTATFVQEHRVALRVLVVALGFAILVILSHPRPLAVLVIGILVIVGLLLVEFLGRTARGDVEANASSRSDG